MAALAGERLRLPVPRHRVARLRDHHLGVEVGTVDPALADLGRRRCEEDALPTRARQLLAYPADADPPRGDELDLLADLALAESVEVGATAGLADAVLVGDRDLLLDEGQLGALLPCLLACFLAGRFTLFGRPRSRRLNRITNPPRDHVSALRCVIRFDRKTKTWPL